MRAKSFGILIQATIEAGAQIMGISCSSTLEDRPVALSNCKQLGAQTQIRLSMKGNPKAGSRGISSFAEPSSILGLGGYGG